jgi:hypothetical protein
MSRTGFAGVLMLLALLVGFMVAFAGVEIVVAQAVKRRRQRGRSMDSCN